MSQREGGFWKHAQASQEGLWAVCPLYGKVPGGEGGMLIQAQQSLGAHSKS